MVSLAREDSNKQVNTLEEDCCYIKSVLTRPVALMTDLSKLQNTEYQKLRIKRNRKAARMLGLLVAAFTVCWLPYIVCYPLSQFYPTLLSDYATLFVWWLGYMNSAINPFLYVYSNKNIRRSVRNLFCKRLVHACIAKDRMHNFRTNSFKANRI